MIVMGVAACGWPGLEGCANRLFQTRSRHGYSGGISLSLLGTRLPSCARFQGGYSLYRYLLPPPCDAICLSRVFSFICTISRVELATTETGSLRALTACQDS